MNAFDQMPDVPNAFTNCKLVGDNIDPEAYHRQDAKRGDPNFVMTRSELMLFVSNPNRWINGYSPKETEATFYGSMIDCWTLDRNRFTKRYVRTPDTCKATKGCKAVKDGKFREGEDMPWNSQLKECKDWKAAQEEEGLLVVTQDNIKDCEDAHKRLMDDHILGEFIRCSRKQVLVVGEYHDSMTKLVIPVKTLIDLVPDKDHADFGKDLGDLKTARNGAASSWHKVVDDRKYHVQARMNLDLYKAATGEDRTSFCHVVQENLFPFQPGRRRLDPLFLTMAGLVYTSALRNYARCLQMSDWPSDDDNPITTLNGWTVVSPEPYMLNRM